VAETSASHGQATARATRGGGGLTRILCVVRGGQVCRNGKGGISVCRIAGYRKDSSGELFILCRWFYSPEETVQGRLPRHGHNELLSGDYIDIAPADTIICRCRVLDPDSYAKELMAVSDPLRTACAGADSQQTLQIGHAAPRRTKLPAA
jgi:hypothetical protein